MSKCIYTQEQFDKILEERNKLANENFKLKQQLAESEKRIKLADYIIKQYADKDKNLYLQLDEKDKEFNWLHQKFAKYAENNQDKISFAVEQLENVKEHISSGLAFDIDVQMWFEEYIDNQIKQLKEGK